ncbi:MAG: hypothetical protein A2W76_03400 [Gammaproteobacteria bacterium RIFCSPLOWO2_12_47_11]|nr:MAG: hypothetical protein A2W76_03400 [Gammaproteobacteria bacterium RIFCSPLOWO2_12_47_11]
MSAPSARAVLESAMATKLALRKRLYNFLGRPSLADAKLDVKKTTRKFFAFGRVPAARKDPVER